MSWPPATPDSGITFRSLRHNGEIGFLCEFDVVLDDDRVFVPRRQSLDPGVPGHGYARIEWNLDKLEVEGLRPFRLLGRRPPIIGNDDVDRRIEFTD